MILKGYVLRSIAIGREKGQWERRFGKEGIDRQAVWSRWESGPFATIALVSKKKNSSSVWLPQVSGEESPSQPLTAAATGRSG